MLAEEFERQIPDEESHSSGESGHFLSVSFQNFFSSFSSANREKNFSPHSCKGFLNLRISGRGIPLVPADFGTDAGRSKATNPSCPNSCSAQNISICGSFSARSITTQSSTSAITGDTISNVSAGTVIKSASSPDTPSCFLVSGLSCINCMKIFTLSLNPS